MLQRRRIINQTERVHRPGIAQQFSPPEASLDANRWNILQVVRGIVAGSAFQAVILLQKKRSLFRIFGRPDILTPPLSRYILQIRIGRVPVLHVDNKARVISNSGIPSLQPIIEPAYRLIPPLDSRAEICIIREGMVPRPDDRLDRSL